MKKFNGKISKNDWRIWNFLFPKNRSNKKCKEQMIAFIEKEYPTWTIIESETQINLRFDTGSEKIGVMAAYKCHSKTKKGNSDL